MTTVYVTTFCVMLAFSRICETLPSNASRGKELTVKRTTWPSWIEPMSVSLTDDQISRRLRSLAIRKRLGASGWRRPSGRC